MRLFMMLLFISASASAAIGLNWEGHEEWMTDMPAAIAYDRAHPQAAPKWNVKPCAAPATPYDQVPLPGRNCIEATKPAPKPEPETVK